MAVLVGTFVALRLVPETLRNTKAFLIRRYTTDWSLVALSVLDRIGRWLEDAHRMVDGRVATLTLLTVLLWGLEISAFRVGMAGLPVDRATVSSVLAPYGCVVLRYGNILEDDGTLMNQCKCSRSLRVFFQRLKQGLDSRADHLRPVRRIHPRAEPGGADVSSPLQLPRPAVRLGEILMLSRLERLQTIRSQKI